MTALLEVDHLKIDARKSANQLMPKTSDSGGTADRNRGKRHRRDRQHSCNSGVDRAWLGDYSLRGCRVSDGVSPSQFRYCRVKCEPELNPVATKIS